MEVYGIDVDTFKQEEKLSAKALERVIGGGDTDPKNCTHDRQKTPTHDRNVHDKQHSKWIGHSRCDHPKK